MTGLHSGTISKGTSPLLLRHTALHPGCSKPASLLGLALVISLYQNPYHCFNLTAEISMNFAPSLEGSPQCGPRLPFYLLPLPSQGHYNSSKTNHPSLNLPQCILLPSLTQKRSLFSIKLSILSTKMLTCPSGPISNAASEKLLLMSLDQCNPHFYQTPYPSTLFVQHLLECADLNTFLIVNS